MAASKKTTGKPSIEAQTPTRTFDDGRFIRTAIIVGEKNDSGSLDIVDGATGARLAQLNIFVSSDGLIVDVIDVDGQFASHRAIGFKAGVPARVETDKLVSTDFRKG